MFVDLHVHSTVSDGTENPPDLLKKAKNIGLELFAITDHDNISGSKLIYKGKRDDSIYFITGVEISAEFKNTLHILGYNFDIENKALNETLANLQEYRLKRNERMIKNMNDSGFKVSLEELFRISGGEQLGRPHFARLMLEKGFVKSYQEAFDKYLKKGAPFYMDKKRLSPEDSIKLIKNAGGLSVLAHPYQTKLEGENLEKLIKKLKSQGLDGIEVFYSLHSEKMTEEYLSYAKKYDLVATSGSDFHGENKKDIKLGMNTPFAYLKDFIKKIITTRKTSGLH
jgi:hypothetical protein